MTIVLLFVVLLALFSLAYVTKRRFGVLGLSLAAGVVIAQNASRPVAEYLEKQQFPVEPLTHISAAIILLTLTPALILLLGGPTYSRKKSALIGAAGFALLGTFFLIGPLTMSLPPAEASVRDVLMLVAEWESVIIVVALALALFDTFMVHGIASPKRRSRKH